MGEIRSEDIFRQMDLKKQEIDRKKRLELEIKAKQLEEAQKVASHAEEESKVMSKEGVEEIDIILRDLKLEDMPSSPSDVNMLQ